MGNSELLRLIKKYELHDDDAVEILRIFEVLSDWKKVEILEDWDHIASQIKAHREEIELEKEILLSKAIANIELEIEEYNKSLFISWTKREIAALKKQK